MNRFQTRYYRIRGLQRLLLVLLVFCGQWSMTAPPLAQGQEDAYRQQRRKMAGGGPEDYGKALRETIRLRDWEESELFLTSGRLEAFDESERRRVAETIGGSLLSRAGMETGLSVSAKAAIEELSKVRIAAMTDPAILDAAIASLGSDSLDAQVKGGQTILAGGTAGLSRLLMAASSPNPPAPLPRLVAVLKGFGKEAVEATEHLVVNGPAENLLGAMRVLFGLDANHAMPFYAASLYSNDAGEEMHALAAAGLSRVYGEVPNHEAAVSIVITLFQEANERALRAVQDGESSFVWSVEGGELRREVTSIRIAEAMRAADYARLAARVGLEDYGTKTAVASALLRSSILSDPLVYAETLSAELNKSLGENAVEASIISNSLSTALGDAIAGGGQIFDEGAAVGACRWLGKFGSPENLAGLGGEKAPLVRAALGSTPRLKYEASRAVAELNPRQPYAGSDLILQNWFEMGNLGPQGRALLLVNSFDLGIAISQRLEAMGLDVSRFQRGSEIIAEIDHGGDIQVVVLTSTPPDFSALELIDRIRRRPLGSVVPMVVVGPERGGLDQQPARWRYPVSVIQWAEGSETSIEGITNRIQESIEESQAVLAIPPLSGVERRWFHDDALQTLSHLADSTDLEHIYHWRDHEEAILGATQRAGYTPETLRLLSGLGSSASQGRLLYAILDDSLSQEIRKQSSVAMAESIQRFGTRLSRKQVIDLYDRYEMATEDAVREDIKVVLEAIEQRANVTTTSR